MLKHVEDFLKLESAGGILLIISAFIAMLWANLGHHSYESFLHLPLDANFLGLELNLGLLHFVNDGLMAIFFLLVGSELREEMKEGYLTTFKQIIFPLMIAVVGFALPAIMYVGLTHHFLSAAEFTKNLSGWPLSSATDIAFALGVLSLFSKRVPVSLKVTLLSLAIFDDVIGIGVIVLFYSHGIDLMYLGYSGAAIGVLLALRLLGSYNLAAYLTVGFFLWAFMLKSGVHATLAGVIVALMLPYGDGSEKKPYLLKNIQHSLHETVSFFIVPLFTICNAGVYLAGGIPGDVQTALTLACIIAASMFVGKTIGIYVSGILIDKIGIGALPEGTSKGMFLGMSMMAGIGFTMSLFFGSLSSVAPEAYKIGVLGGTLVSLLIGCFTLHLTLPKANRIAD